LSEGALTAACTRKETSKWPTTWTLSDTLGELQMAVRAESSNARQLYLYFGILTFLIFLDTPEILLDIPTSYILKDHLHATASQVSMFRLLTGIPLYIGFAFGLVRDLWNPFGWRDPGYFRIFVPLTVSAFAWMAFSHLSYSGLLAGMILAMLSSRLSCRHIRD